MIYALGSEQIIFCILIEMQPRKLYLTLTKLLTFFISVVSRFESAIRLYASKTTNLFVSFRMTYIEPEGLIFGNLF